MQSFLIALALMQSPAAPDDCLDYPAAYKQAQAKQCTPVVFYDTASKAQAYRFTASLADSGYPLDGEAPGLVNVSNLSASSRKYWAVAKQKLPFASVLRHEDGHVMGGGILRINSKTTVDGYALWLTHQKRRHLIPASQISVTERTS